MNIDDEYQNLPLIKVVGISASGKSTLVGALRRHGYRARPVSQEHSDVPSLWQQFEEPAILIHLDIDLPAQRLRRPDVSWSQRVLREEHRRLAEAVGNANLKIDTSALTAEDVLRIALTFLQQRRIRHTDHPLPRIQATGSAIQQNQEALPAAEELPDKLTKKQRKRLSKRGASQSPAK